MQSENAVKRENQLISGVLLGFFVSGICSMALGSLIPFFRESYHLSYDDSGMLLSLLSVGHMISILLMGYLPSFLGRRKSVLMTSVWLIVAYVIVTFGVGGAVLLPMACFMMGFARGGSSNFSNTMMSTLPGKKSGIGYNLLHGSYAVGALLAPLLVIFCTRESSAGWRYAALILFVLTIIQAIDYIKIPLPAENIKKSTRSVDYGFVKHKFFWLASAILFFYISAEYAITGWLVTYFQDIGILSDNLSQMMSTLLWSVMFIGRLVGAFLSGKVSCKVLLGIDGIGLLVFFLLVFFSRTVTPIVIGIAGVGLFMATIYPSAMALATDSVRGNDLGISTMALMGSIGGMLTPAAVGFVAEQAGIQAGMSVVVLMTALLFGTIMITLFTKETNSTEE